MVVSCGEHLYNVATDNFIIDFRVVADGIIYKNKYLGSHIKSN